MKTCLPLRAVIVLGLVAVTWLTDAARAADPVQLTLVGYGVAKPVFAKIIPAFKKQYKQQTGQDVTFKESYGGSGAQTRAILGGLDADILATNVQAYVDPLVTAGLVKADWATRVPNGASPASSVIVAVTRSGNPKNIKTWADLANPGVEIVSLNPKTSGNARWGVLGGYFASGKQGETFVRGLVHNTKTLAAGGREATDAFLKNGVGDVLITFENEAKFANKVGGGDLPYVAFEPNVRVDFPVTLIDKNVDTHGTRQAAEAFVNFLFTEPAQTIYAQAGYRPFDPKVLAKFAENYSKVEKQMTIADVGGWAAVNKLLFDDGALYDQAASGK